MAEKSASASIKACLRAVLMAITVYSVHVAAISTAESEGAEIKVAGNVEQGAEKLLNHAGSSVSSEGSELYQTQCGSCHNSGGVRVPPLLVLREMAPEAIYSALVDGAMRIQGEALSLPQKKAVAEFIAGRKLREPDAVSYQHRCSGQNAVFDHEHLPVFNNWGFDLSASHFIADELAGINRHNVNRLSLKWAYAFPGSQRMRSQPVIVGGAIILGNHTGEVHAVDMESGCLRWHFSADAEVRTAVIASSWNPEDTAAQPLIYFGDLQSNVYALDARNGELVWKVAADSHSAAVITGAPALYKNTLYVPVSSIEEASAASPGYECCTFRGSVLALNAATGKEKWRRYLVGQASLTKEGQWGPSGVAVWNSPVIDPVRNQLYFATGDNYSNPPTALSDSVMALDLDTGEINWHYQALEGDAWNVACVIGVRDNCPEDEGPDFDFGAGTILASDKQGRELLLAGQKSGIVYALDPDKGEVVWQTRVGRGGPAGGILFGMAVANGQVFVPVTDLADIPGLDYPASPGLYSLDMTNGNFLWRSPADNVCQDRPGCVPGIFGTVSATSELVFAGSSDGHLRIHDAATGEIVWQYDTVADFETVNKVAGFGGAIGGGAAPLAYNGKLFVVSGYGFAGRMPGNVLLVFEVGSGDK